MIKILVITVRDKDSGINKYRIFDPHIKLQNLFPNDFYVELGRDSDILNTEKVKQFDAIFYHAALEQVDQVSAQITFLKSLGIKIILDIDDFWDYHISHPYYNLAKQINLKEKTTRGFKKADLITTTSDFFVERLKKYNNNVVCLPNSLDLNEKQCQINNTDHELTHIGFVGGSSHLEDIKLLRGVFNSLSNKKTQMQLCGFNVTKETALQSVWLKMEEIFTNNHKLKDPNFVDYLFEFKQTEAYPNQAEMEYKRVWTKSIITYMHSYDDLDICVAPLTNIEFNYFKSNLKMLEAGIKKKPIIVSGVQPYLDGVHGENCLIVEPRKEHKNWIKYVNQLVDSKQMQIDLGENLYNYVTANFDLNKTAAKRAEVYKNLFKKN